MELRQYIEKAIPAKVIQPIPVHENPILKGFLRSLITQNLPEWNSTRLILADWLEENGFEIQARSIRDLHFPFDGVENSLSPYGCWEWLNMHDGPTCIVLNQFSVGELNRVVLVPMVDQIGWYRIVQQFWNDRQNTGLFVRRRWISKHLCGGQLYHYEQGLAWLRRWREHQSNKSEIDIVEIRF